MGDRTPPLVLEETSVEMLASRGFLSQIVSFQSSDNASSSAIILDTNGLRTQSPRA